MKTIGRLFSVMILGIAAGTIIGLIIAQNQGYKTIIKQNDSENK